MHLQRNVLLSEWPVLRWAQLIVYASVILYFGSPIFIPLSFALLISFVLYPVCRWLERRGVGRLMAVVIALSALLVLGLVLAGLLVFQFVSFAEEWPAVHEKIVDTFNLVNRTFAEIFGVSVSDQQDAIPGLSELSGTDVVLLIREAFAASAASMLLLVLIPVYVVLVLYYRKYWMKILGRLLPSEKKEDIHALLGLATQAYYNFIKGMAVVYLIVGILNSLGLWILGIPHAVLFGFVASILTFIPYVGIVAGSLLPVAMAWITYDSVWYSVGVIAVFTVVQYLEANVIFPIAVSTRLSVNTLAMLIAIFTGGILWGVAGMILFVPFVGIARLVATHNPRWKTISMILGNEHSEIQHEDQHKMA